VKMGFHPPKEDQEFRQDSERNKKDLRDSEKKRKPLQL